MTPCEANQIDINNETDLDKLKELVSFWQNQTINVVAELQKHRPTFILEDMQGSNDETGN